MNSSSNAISGPTPKSADTTSEPSGSWRPVKITQEQRVLLLVLADIPGADVWDRPDAALCRQLEPLGLVRIVKAKGAPKDGAARQPFFGVKITAAGHRSLAYAAKALGREAASPAGGSSQTLDEPLNPPNPDPSDEEEA